MAEYTRVKTTFEPVYDENSRVLILGTFPSVKSREENFYYGHPQNRFWRLIANLTGEEVPTTTEEKKDLLLRHGIALWDVVLECDIIGSSDSSIHNVVPADINRILKSANIEKIITNGATAHRLYEKYCRESTGRSAVKCPSTSPANAAYGMEQLEEEWGKIMADFAH